MKILFVCLGNICRSPIAEGVLRTLAKQHHLQWQIGSAGTESIHVGEQPHHYSQQVCKENSIDISHQRAAQFSKNDLDRYDLIYSMSSDVYDILKKTCGASFDENKIRLFLDEIYPSENRSVKDPWYGELDGYYEVYDEIRKGCEAIIANHSGEENNKSR